MFVDNQLSVVTQILFNLNCTKLLKVMFHWRGMIGQLGCTIKREQILFKLLFKEQKQKVYLRVCVCVRVGVCDSEKVIFLSFHSFEID